MLHSTEHLPSPDTPASLHHSSRREISSLPCTQPPRGSPLPSNKIPAPCWTLKTCGLGPCSLSDSPPVSPPAPSAPATPASSPSPHKPGCFLPGGLCCSPFHKLSCGWPWHSGLRSDVTCTERPAQALPALESPHAHAFYLLFNSQQRLGSICCLWASCQRSPTPPHAHSCLSLAASADFNPAGQSLLVKLPPHKTALM